MRPIQPRSGGTSIWIPMILAIAALVSVYPFYKMLVGSLQRPDQIIGGASSLWPAIPPRWANYGEMYDRLPVIRQLGNTLLVASTTTTLMLTISVLAGYAFAKHHFHGQNVLFSLFLLTMALPLTTVIIPLFVTMRELGWLNTYQALILPGAANGFGIFWLRQYIANAVPNELLDAARLDGAGELRIVAQIVVPLIRPALAALATLWFMVSWNDYFWPLIVLNSQDMQTLPVGVGGLVGVAANVGNLGVVLAGAVVGTAPLVLIFVLFNRHVLSGLTEGALRG